MKNDIIKTNSGLTRIKNLNTRYVAYQKRAESKDLKFDIPLIIFTSLITKPCYFCGDSLELSTVGVDRLNNDEGYISGNCVACCWQCNRSKSNQTVDEFVSFIRRFDPNYEVKSVPLRWSDKSVRLLNKLYSNYRNERS